VVDGDSVVKLVGGDTGPVPFRLFTSDSMDATGPTGFGLTSNLEGLVGCGEVFCWFSRGTCEAV